MMMRAALWVFAGKLGNQVITLGIVMILARLLTPEDFGIVAASQVILVLSQVVVRFGIGAYLIQAEVLTPRIIGTAQTLILTAALAISALLLPLAGPIGDAINVPQLAQIMPVLLASFILSAAINPSASLLSREMEFKFLARTEVASHAIGYGAVAIALAALEFGFWAIILGTFAQTLMRALLVFRRVPVWPSLSMTLSEITPMLRFGGGVFLAQLMSNTAQRVDNLIITATMGPAALGYYSRAYSLMEISNKLIGSVFRETLFSGFSKKRREGQRTERDATFLMGHAFAAFLIVPIMALMWLLAKEIIFVLLGSNWDAAVPVLKILALGMFFRLGYKVSGTFILSEGAVYSLAVRNLVYAILVASGAWIGSRWGISGVAWGVFCALAVHFLSMTCAALQHCESSWHAYAKTVFPFLLSGALASVLVFGANAAMDVMMDTIPAISALTAAAIFCSVYAAALFLARGQNAVQPVWVRIARIARMTRGGRDEGR
jgi:PST family polysaccharide transporter